MNPKTFWNFTANLFFYLYHLNLLPMMGVTFFLYYNYDDEKVSQPVPQLLLGFYLVIVFILWIHYFYQKVYFVLAAIVYLVGVMLFRYFAANEFVPVVHIPQYAEILFGIGWIGCDWMVKKYPLELDEEQMLGSQETEVKKTDI